MSEHIKEPWYKSITVGTDVYVDGDNKHIAVVRENANAERIIVCVNACEGITTEYLQEYGRNPDPSEILKQRDDLREQMVLISQMWNGQLKFATMRQALMAIMEIVNMNINHANHIKNAETKLEG